MSSGTMDKHMIIKTRIFELSTVKYANLSELAQAMAFL